MTNFLRFCTFVFCYFILLQMPIFAQNKADSTVIEWDEMNKNQLVTPEFSERDKVVSASRSERSVRDLPVTIHVITGEEIRKNGYTTLADALKSVSGFMVSKPGSGTEGELFLMRGFVGNYYSKILINNIPIQSSVVSGMPISEQLPIRQAERIEIIYGPSSSIYGADALSGVINIIMGSPNETVFAQADIMTGQNGYKHLNFTIGGKFGYDKNLVKYTAYGIYGEREKLNFGNNQAVFNPLLYSPDSSHIKFPNYQGTLTQPSIGELPSTSHALGVQMKWRGFTLNIDRQYRRDASAVGLITNFYNYKSNDIFFGENSTRYALNHLIVRGKWSFTTNLSYLKYRKDNQTSFKFNFTAGQNGRVFKYAAADDIFAEQLVTFRASERWELTTGISMTYSGNLPKTNDLDAPFNYGDYTSFSTTIGLNDPLFGKFGYNPIVYNNVASFVQGFYTKNRFSAIVGFRYDKHSIYGSSVNPRFALLYKLNNKFTLRSYTGTAFRAPSPYYSYNSVAVPSGAPNGVFYLQIPNTKLAPESFSATEFALRYDYNKKLNFEAIAFYQQILSQIYNSTIALDPLLYPNTTQTTANGYVNDNKNSEGAYLAGLQLKAQFFDLFLPYQLGGNVSLTISKGREKLPDGETVIEEFRQMPRFLGQFELHGNPIKNLYLQTIFVTTSSWYARDVLDRIASKTELTTKGYFVLDFLARYQTSKHLSVFAKVQNVFDAAYGGIGATGSSLDLRYNPQLGRNIQLGISFRTN